MSKLLLLLPLMLVGCKGCHEECQMKVVKEILGCRSHDSSTECLVRFEDSSVGWVRSPTVGIASPLEGTCHWENDK